MSLYSSRRGADLSWAVGQEITTHPTTFNGQPASLVVRDTPQINPTNPILTDIRKNRPEGVSWANMLKHYNWVTFAAAHYITEDWERITDEGQIDHARKVLTRLAALGKEES